MALFKIFKGTSANLPAEMHDGYCYFTTDDGKFYIDYLETDGVTLKRRPISGPGQSVEYIVGTQTASTAIWTGVTKDSALYVGKIIAYKLPTAGTSAAATLNLTFPDGTTSGAISVKRQGASGTTTHYPANTVIFMAYDGTYWQVNADYDSNSNDTTTNYGRYSYGQFAPTTALYRYQLLLTHPTDSSKLIPANTTSNTTGTTKTTITTEAFNPFEPFYYYSTTDTVAAGTLISASYIWYSYGRIDIRYPFNTGSTLVTNKDVYLVAQLQADGSAKLRNPGATGNNASAQATGANAGPITQILPTSEDGYIYIKLGHATDDYRVSLDFEHPIYVFKNGVLRQFAQDANTVNGLTVETAVPANAVFTDRYVNSASFSDDSTNNNVKMTLTRAGSDTATVTANIPKISSSSAGVVPKGTAVSSQSQTTKFLREDGTWAAPSYTTNTNTDTLVKQTAKTDDVNYKVLFTTSASPTSGNAAETAYDTDITLNPSTNTITATNFAGNASTATSASKLQNTAKIGDTNKPVYFTAEGVPAAISYTIATSVPSGAIFTDTKNTAGSTDTSSKIFLIGATEQAANPQTYSDNEVFATSGVLTAKTFNSTSLTASQAVSTDASKNLVSTNLTVSDPTASGTGIEYIASISQSAVGKITATKSTVRTASTSQTGVIQINATNANSFINQLSTGSSTPTDADYYISQYVGGGTSTTTYHRRPMSALWDYIKGKITDNIYWANEKTTSSASYKTTPEVATIKLNGDTSATAASTKNVQLIYDSTLEVLNFVFS